jgi:hypothetical protein
MSALGQKRTSELVQSMSVVSPIADIRTGPRYARRNSSGGLAMFAAIRRASYVLSNGVAERRPDWFCLDFHGVDLRHATSSAFKDIIDIKVLKSRRSSERHNSSAAWATRRRWRVFTRMFVAHGGQRSLNRKCPPKPEPGCIRSGR